MWTEHPHYRLLVQYLLFNIGRRADTYVMLIKPEWVFISQRWYVKGRGSKVVVACLSWGEMAHSVNTGPSSAKHSLLIACVQVIQVIQIYHSPCLSGRRVVSWSIRWDMWVCESPIQWVRHINACPPLVKLMGITDTHLDIVGQTVPTETVTVAWNFNAVQQSRAQLMKLQMYKLHQCVKALHIPSC